MYGDPKLGDLLSSASSCTPSPDIASICGANWKGWKGGKKKAACPAAAASKEQEDDEEEEESNSNRPGFWILAKLLKIYEISTCLTVFVINFEVQEIFFIDLREYIGDILFTAKIS